MLLLLSLDSHGGAAKPPTVGSHLSKWLGPRAVLIAKNIRISVKHKTKYFFNVQQNLYELLILEK